MSVYLYTIFKYIIINTYRKNIYKNYKNEIDYSVLFLRSLPVQVNAPLLGNASCTEPILVLLGLLVDADAQPVVPVITLVTADHGRSVVLLPARRAYPNHISGFIRVNSYGFSNYPRAIIIHALSPWSGPMTVPVSLHPAAATAWI